MDRKKYNPRHDRTLQFPQRLTAADADSFEISRGTTRALFLRACPRFTDAFDPAI
jgi:hypothetical protein